MTWFIICIAVCLCLGTSAAIFGTLLMFMMIGEVNRKKDDAHQIPYLSLNPMRRDGMFSEYRRLYPSGRLHIYIFAAFAVMAIGIGGAFLVLCLMGVISPPPPSRPATH